MVRVPMLPHAESDQMTTGKTHPTLVNKHRKFTTDELFKCLIEQSELQLVDFTTLIEPTEDRKIIEK